MIRMSHLAAPSALVWVLLAAGVPSARADERNNVLVVGMTSEPFTLDPATGFSGFDYPNLYPIYDRLVRFDPKTLELLPGLATAWEFTGPDKLTLELTLRHGVQFQDNTLMDAEAVKASLLHFKSAGRIHDLDPVTAVDVLAPDRLALRLKEPYSVLPTVLSDRAGMVVSPTAVVRWGGDFSRHPVGAGPFMLKKWSSGSSIELARFPDYWDKDRPQLAGIQFRIILNPTSLISALLSGQVDHGFGVDPKDLVRLEASPRLRVSKEPSVSFYELALNDSLAPVNNKLVRQAINMSVDRSALSDAILGPGRGGGSALMLVPPSSFAYSAELEESVPYDPTRAKALLAEAGFPDGITLKVCATPLVGYGTDITDIEREQMRPAGITLDVTVMTGSACFQSFILRNGSPAWQGAFSGRPDPFLTYEQNMGSSGQYNVGRVAYPGVDTLLKQILSTYTKSEQKPLFTALNKAWIENAPSVLLFYRPNYAVYGRNVTGEQPNLLGKVDLTTLRFVK
jgi:peptide/nickel transport system substrate-binding protein